MSAPLLPPGPWTERYENLRQHAVDQPQRLGSAPLGLGLVQHQGVASWMRAWEPVGATGGAAQVPALSVPRLPSPVWQQHLTQLLAQMALAHLPTPAEL